MNGNMNLGKRVTVLEKGGGAAIKKEISDLQDAVTKAQSDIDALETKVNNGHVYSTEEKVVGTWIDGTTAYERTFALDNPANELVLLENVNHLITQTGHWVQVEKPSEEQLFPREHNTNQSAMVGVLENNLTLMVTGINILRCAIIVQYTKTTDTPTQ